MLLECYRHPVACCYSATATLPHAATALLPPCRLLLQRYCHPAACCYNATATLPHAATALLLSLYYGFPVTLLTLFTCKTMSYYSEMLEKACLSWLVSPPLWINACWWHAATATLPHVCLSPLMDQCLLVACCYFHPAACLSLPPC